MNIYLSVHLKDKNIENSLPPFRTISEKMASELTWMCLISACNTVNVATSRCKVCRSIDLKATLDYYKHRGDWEFTPEEIRAMPISQTEQLLQMRHQFLQEEEELKQIPNVNHTNELFTAPSAAQSINIIPWTCTSCNHSNRHFASMPRTGTGAIRCFGCTGPFSPNLAETTAHEMAVAEATKSI